LSSSTKKGEIESAFAPYVGFGVLMTSNLGTNALYLRFAAATRFMKVAKVQLKIKWYPPIFVREKGVGFNLELIRFYVNLGIYMPYYQEGFKGCWFGEDRVLKSFN
jgi:hypothetical protein